MNPGRWVVHSARLLDGTGADAVEDGWLAAEDGRVVATGSGPGWRDHAGGVEEVTDASGRLLTPGFVDIHRHGGGGCADEDGPEAMLAAAYAHLAHGTTSGVVSFVAADVDELADGLSAVAELVDQHPGLILGSHLEGPFLSVARRGAHDEARLRDPSDQVVDRLLAAARGTLRQVTIDPRRAGADEAIRRFVDTGVTVAVGHTEADYDESRSAFAAGARLLTHTFNAMPGIHHRAPGPVVAALDDPDVVLELILDGQHVHPRVAAMLFDLAPDRIALITDAMAAAAVPGDGPAHYRLGVQEIDVVDGRAVMAGTDTLAGSTLTLDVAVRVGLTAGLPLPALVRAATSTPARAIGSDGIGLLVPGSRADVVVLDEDACVVEVRRGGERVKG